VPAQLQMPLARPLVQIQYPRQSGVVPPARNISIGEFHEFLGLRESEFNSVTEFNDSRTILDQAQQLRVNRLNPSSIPTLNSSLLDHVLQDFMQDSSARFRSSYQREAFYLILLRQPYCFIILPTAGGKTTLFLIKASLATSQITIIISPLIALKIDLFNKAAALGLQPVL